VLGISECFGVIKESSLVSRSSFHETNLRDIFYQNNEIKIKTAPKKKCFGIFITLSAAINNGQCKYQVDKKLIINSLQAAYTIKILFRSYKTGI